MRAVLVWVLAISLSGCSFIKTRPIHEDAPLEEQAKCGSGVGPAVADTLFTLGLGGGSAVMFRSATLSQDGTETGEYIVGGTLAALAATTLASAVLGYVRGPKCNAAKSEYRHQMEAKKDAERAAFDSRLAAQLAEKPLTPEEQSAIASKQLFVGMRAVAVEKAFGEPLRVSQTISATGTAETWEACGYCPKGDRGVAAQGPKGRVRCCPLRRIVFDAAGSVASSEEVR